MRQLTSLDAQFLALETARQSGHVAGLAILDPSTAPGGRLDVMDLQALIAERLPLLPPLRWRLAEVPLGLDYPYWVDDADFDLEFHVRELGLPPPGTDSQLADLHARQWVEAGSLESPACHPNSPPAQSSPAASSRVTCPSSLTPRSRCMPLPTRSRSATAATWPPR